MRVNNILILLIVYANKTIISYQAQCMETIDNLPFNDMNENHYSISCVPVRTTCSKQPTLPPSPPPPNTCPAIRELYFMENFLMSCHIIIGV